jgi:hypothetical protein
LCDLPTGLGVDLGELEAQRARRPLLRFCLDWSEQRHPVGGRLGAAILTALLKRGWIARTRRRRALVITDHGLDNLDRQLNLTRLLS